jgi:hypothetical protein
MSLEEQENLEDTIKDVIKTIERGKKGIHDNDKVSGYDVKWSYDTIIERLREIDSRMSRL